MILILRNFDQKWCGLENTEENKNLIVRYLSEVGTPEADNAPPQPRMAEEVYKGERAPNDDEKKALKDWFKLSWPATEELADRMKELAHQSHNDTHGVQLVEPIGDEPIDMVLIFRNEW